MLKSWAWFFQNLSRCFKIILIHWGPTSWLGFINVRSIDPCQAFQIQPPSFCAPVSYHTEAWMPWNSKGETWGAGESTKNGIWTLPETNIAHENRHFPGKYHQNVGISMAMLVYRSEDEMILDVWCAQVDWHGPLEYPGVPSPATPSVVASARP